MLGEGGPDNHVIRKHAESDSNKLEAVTYIAMEQTERARAQYAYKLTQEKEEQVNNLECSKQAMP